MPIAQFGEGQYEQDLLVDLKSRHGAIAPHFRPTQALEHPLGFDLAVNTALPRLAAPGVFTSSVLRPRVDPKLRAQIPAAYVTAFLQTKRPFHVTRRHKKTRKQWNAWQRPYFRLDLSDSAQHATLLALERDLQGQALVRYAAPCFASWAEAKAHAANGCVADRSHFQSPGRIGNHETYTYRSPLQPGVRFSDPEEVPVTPFPKDVRDTLNESPLRSLLQHLIDIWNSSTELTEQNQIRLDDDAIQEAVHLAVPQWVDLEIEPLGLVEGTDGWLLHEVPEGPITYGTYAALLFGVEFLADSLQLQIRTFWYDHILW